jgi:stearoyl-CoA desaturase (delta-9 desaturase)
MYTWQSSLITFLLLSHFSGAVFSIYVHRGLGHHYFTFNSKLAHIFRFWLWFASGHCWPNWMQHYAAKHRKHHVTSDTLEDPHSPFYYSFWQMCNVSHNDPNKPNYITLAEIKQYAPDITTPNDWVERNVYCKYPRLGLILFWSIMWVLFGWAGFVLGAINYFFIGAFFIFFGNWAFHKIGFNYASKGGVDKSKIFFPWAIFSGGEELHAHHHNDPSLPYHSRHWWEFDIGWMYCRILMFFGLMQLREKGIKNV